MRTLSILALAGMVVLGLGTGRAGAEPGDAKAAAEQLFQQGRTLSARGDHAAACPKFEASLALDPALGTLLNLATCYEKVGRLASAWARFREAADLAIRAGQARREQFARQRASAIEPRVPRLRIRVPDSDRTPGLTVMRNGMPVDPTLFDTPIYVDPGVHEVVATAPGRAAFSVEVAVTEAGEEVVDVPRLGSASGEAAGVADAATREEGRPGGTRRVIGLAAGGAGVAAVAAGLSLGWLAKRAWDDAFDSGQCNAASLVCTPAGQARTDTARRRAAMSTLTVGAGVALVAAGMVLYLTAPERDRATARLMPAVGADALGFAVTGRF